MPNTPDNAPVITPQRLDNRGFYGGYPMSAVTLKGNRTTDPKGSLSYHFTSWFYLPNNPLEIGANLGLWVLSSAFSTSILSIAPGILASAAIAFLALMGIGTYAYWYTNPDMRWMILLRMTLVTIGLAIGVYL